MKPLKKLPYLIEGYRNSLDKNKHSSINIYFQDESRFGLMTPVGRKLTAKGVKPIAKYKHAFKNTYLFGAFSPINGDAVVYEIGSVNSDVFYAYLVELSLHKPKELKVVVIDNAGFHSLKGRKLPDNIRLLNIPPYSPELNPCERVWGYIKSFFREKFFEDMEQLRAWLHDFMANALVTERIKSLTQNELYTKPFIAHVLIIGIRPQNVCEQWSVTVPVSRASSIKYQVSTIQNKK